MAQSIPLDDFLKLLSAVLGALGTWLTLRNFYAARKKELEQRHLETLEKYAESQKKAYAAERDFNHLRNDLAQLKESLRMAMDEADETKENVIEMKSTLRLLMSQSAKGRDILMEQYDSERKPNG